MTLGEVAEFEYGFTATARASGGYRFIRITDITEGGKLSSTEAKYVDATPESSEYLTSPGDLLVARTGATFGKTVLVIDDEPAAFASFLIRITVNTDVVMPAFYWHFAQSSAYWRQAQRLVTTGGQPQFNANVLKVIALPVPSLDEQRRIVAILDRFDALVNDLSVGLPAELSARRRQYEHYRDRLLTFREAN
jgi:type I restriction enzyme S subunit